MENEIKKRERGGKPKRLEAQKTMKYEPQSPWRKKKEKKRNLDQKMEEEPV